MNYFRFHVILVLAAVAAALVTPHNKFERGLIKVIENMIYGDVGAQPATFNSLRSLKIPPIQYKYEHLYIYVSEMNVEGLENLSVDNLSASLSNLSLKIEISVPTLAIHADWYHLRVKIFGLFKSPIPDNMGRFSANINNLVVKAETQFESVGNDTVMKSLVLHYSVDDIQVQLSGATQKMNDFVNEKISNLLTNYEMKEKLQETVIDRVNGYLKAHNFERGLIKVIENMIYGDVGAQPATFNSLRSLKIPPIQYNYEHYVISVSELNVEGLENLSVDNLSASLSNLSLKIEMSVPTLAIRADWYNLRLTLFELVNIIDDKGIFNASINNLVVKAETQFESVGNDTVMKSLVLHYSVDDIQVQLHGSSLIMNYLVNEKISNLLTNYEMKEKLQETVIDRVNGYLKDVCIE